MIAGLGSDEQKRTYFTEVVEKGALIASVGGEVMPQQMKSLVATMAAHRLFWLKTCPGRRVCKREEGSPSTAKGGGLHGPVGARAGDRKAAAMA